MINWASRVYHLLLFSSSIFNLYGYWSINHRLWITVHRWWSINHRWWSINHRWWFINHRWWLWNNNLLLLQKLWNNHRWWHWNNNLLLLQKLWNNHRWWHWNNNLLLLLLIHKLWICNHNLAWFLKWFDNRIGLFLIDQAWFLGWWWWLLYLINTSINLAWFKHINHGELWYLINTSINLAWFKYINHGEFLLSDNWLFFQCDYVVSFRLFQLDFRGWKLFLLEYRAKCVCKKCHIISAFSLFLII